MILADKIIRLRKKNAWSQEEFAAKMNVSRQAVSKWEAAQTTPDLEKILQLSNLFGVTTDYLLKDEIEYEEFTDSADEMPIRRLTLAEANEYLEQRKDASVKTAIATFLCIICAVPLFLLMALSKTTSLLFSDSTAIGIGVVVIFPIIAAAVSLFLRVGFQNAPYEFLEKEPFETEYGVTGLVKERQKAYRSTYAKYNCIGACSCILSPVPLLCSVFSENDPPMMFSLCITVIAVGIGVMFFIIAGVRWASMQKILKEGEYSDNGKEKRTIGDAIETAYWLIVTAAYLGWSFLTNDWHITWVVWPIAGILFGAVEVICHLVINSQEEK